MLVDRDEEVCLEARRHGVVLVRPLLWAVALSGIGGVATMPAGIYLLLNLRPQAYVLAMGSALVLYGVYTTWLLVRKPEELAFTENHPSWTHMYMMMMVAQVGFALAYAL